MDIKELYPSSGGGGGDGGDTGSGFQPKEVKTQNFECEPNSAYPVDTTGTIIIATLPPSLFLNNGDRVQFFDAVGSSDFYNPSGFGKNKLIISPKEGQTILGYNDSFEISHDNETITFTYYDERWAISGGVRSQPAYSYTPEYIEYVFAKIMENQT